jgi:tol-pal system protein YbgF
MKLFTSGIRLFLLGLALAFMSGVTAAPTHAQSNNDIAERLRLIDQVLNDLQRAVYKGETPPPRSAAGPQASAGAASNGGKFADIEVRLGNLEEQLRSLTGPIETAEHRVNVIGNRLDKLIEDIDFRLSAIERKLSDGGLADKQTTGEQPVATSDTTIQAPASDGTTAVVQKVVGDAAAGTQVLGTVPAGDVAAGQQQTAAIAPVEPAKPKGVLPEGSVRERYDYAYGLLRRLKMNEAEVALKEFLVAHVEDPLADNARYWLGETYFNRRDYTNAAATFFAAYSKAPKGLKARDNLFKLGKSLARMNQKDDACASFDELLTKFNEPADQRIRQRAEFDRTELGCQ